MRDAASCASTALRASREADGQGNPSRGAATSSPAPRHIGAASHRILPHLAASRCISVRAYAPSFATPKHFMISSTNNPCPNAFG